MKAKDVMTKALYTLPPSSKLSEAVKLMAQYNIGSVLVVSEGKLAGIITERDVVRLVNKGVSLDTPLEEVMTRDVVTVKPDDPLVIAVALMVQHNIRHVPVVDENNVPQGIVSVRDVIREIL